MEDGNFEIYLFLQRFALVFQKRSLSCFYGSGWCQSSSGISCWIIIFLYLFRSGLSKGGSLIIFTLRGWGLKPFGLSSSLSCSWVHGYPGSHRRISPKEILDRKIRAIEKIALTEILAYADDNEGTKSQWVGIKIKS